LLPAPWGPLASGFGLYAVFLLGGGMAISLLVNDPRFRQMYRLVDAPGVSGIFARRDEP
jgi:hypothetical protein